MKFQKESQKYIDHTSRVSQYIEEEKDFHLASEAEYEALHQVLEEEGMELKNFLDLKYSRRPGLVESYLESMQVPAIVTDRKNNFLGVMSEMTIRSYEKEKDIFYTSDLRLSKGAGIRTRMNFRKMYVNVLRQIELECFTVVLKDNIKAINALTKNKFDLHYYPVYEYTSRSILVLPTFRFLSNSLKGVRIQEGRDLEFESEKRALSCFSHDSSQEDEYFQLIEGQRTVASFSISRPKNRNLRVEAKTNSVRFWINFANKLFSHDYEQKLPWIYLTSLYIDPQLDRSECLKLIMKYLYKRGKIKKGEIFLFCHDAKEQVELKVMAPEFKVNGVLFRVTADQPDTTELSGPIYLNPICL